ncbi:MAG: YggT family protein [Firmicutes bacterium]|nr:YggT family protein [Bacillota bacterium]
MSIHNIVYYAIEVYIWIIIARIILSWVKINPYTPLVRFVYEITEPVLGFFRRVIPPVGVLDLSPIVVFFILKIVQVALVNLLHRVGL